MYKTKTLHFVLAGREGEWKVAMYKEHDAALEVDLDILASLVLDMEHPDDHMLEVIATIAERLQEYTQPRAKAGKLARQILLLIQEIQKERLPFDKGYAALCTSIQMLQRDVRDWALQTAHSSINETLDAMTHDELAQAEKLDTQLGQVDTQTKSDSEPKHPLVILDFNPNDPDSMMFIAEVEESIDSAEISLIALEKNPGDRAHLDEVFRCFHNIKGISGFVGLDDFQKLCHHAESLMECTRTGTLEFKGALIETVFQALDLLKEMIGFLKQSGGADTPYKTPPAFWDVVNSLKEHCAQSGQLKDVCDDSGKSYFGDELNKEDVNTNDFGSKVDSRESVQSKTQSNKESNTEKTRKNSVNSIRHQAQSDEVVRVSTKRLDALLDEIGELVIANSMVSQEVENLEQVDSKLVQNVSRMNKIVRQLQELTMGMRMVSLESTFNKLARVVRDLSHKTGVKVNFVCDGGDTELDRKVVELITSPLTHLVRNAIDHGIEPPDERERLGKPSQGQVHLSAFHQGGSVAIRVQDDGRGLDKDYIAEKAVELRLMKTNATLTDNEIYQFIFAPGFSTTEQVTDISGRGVGMDVVKRNIESLRGKIDVQTEPGKGTAFTLWFPLTMAIIDGMIVTVGKQRFIIPSISIQESLRPKPDDVKTVMDKGEYISIRGKLIPLYRLYQLMDIKNARTNPWKALVLVTYGSNNQYAILVDDLVGQQQVVVKPAGKFVDELDFISGAAIMGDGRVALILDPSQVVRTAGR